MDPIVISTIVGAAATVANLFISGFLWWTTRRATNLTQKMVESSNRPYIGIDRIDGVELNGYMRGDILFKNFGTVPAKDVWIDIKRFHNGKETDSLNTNSSPMIVHQGGGFINQVIITNNLFPALQKGQLVLEFIVEIHYKGFSNIQYTGVYKLEYAPERGAFGIKSGEEITHN